jgi:hypothetical protein
MGAQRRVQRSRGRQTLPTSTARPREWIEPGRISSACVPNKSGM